MVRSGGRRGLVRIEMTGFLVLRFVLHYVSQVGFLLRRVVYPSALGTVAGVTVDIQEY